MSPTIDQKEIFLDSEADAWFERNFQTIHQESLKHGMSSTYDIYLKYLKKDSKVLEIGCSSGWNLEFLRSQIGCECYGIDPSKKAIEYGRKLFPHISISNGTAENLKFESEYFDFVLFGFCLYLIDRKYLMQSISEADRVLKDGGYLGITDFDEKVPKIRPYRHFEGVNSYKMDYSSLFTAYPHYVLCEKKPFTMRESTFSEKEGERVSSSILFKNSKTAYLPEQDNES